MGATSKVLVLKLHSSQLRRIPYRHMKVAESYEFSILLKLYIAWDLGSTHVKVTTAGIQNMLSGIRFQRFRVPFSRVWLLAVCRV